MAGASDSNTEGLGGAGNQLGWLALFSIGAFLAPFDGSAVTVALPSISDSLHLGYAQTLWVPMLYLLVVAGLLLPTGRSADRRGRASHYAVGLGVFCAGSVLAGFAPGVWWLLAGRCCQGLGGALIVTTSAALAAETVPPGQRGRALGINTMCVYIGAAAGPPLGGLLVVALGWRAVFFFSAAVAALILAALVVMLPSRSRSRLPRTAEPGPRFEPGSLLLALGLVGVLLSLTFGGFWGWTSWRVIAALLVAAGALVALVLRERRSTRPLVAPDLYRGNRTFVVACTAALLTYTAIYGIPLLTAVHLQVVQGLGAGAAGSILLVQPVMMASLAPFAGRLYDRVGSRGPTTGGALVMALGALALAALGPGSGWPATIAGLALIGAGLALFSTPNISAVLASVEPRRLSVASAVLGTNRFVGQALSVGLLGAIAAAQLGGSTATSLRAQIAANGGNAAFVGGFRWAMMTGASIAVAAALVSASRGRQPPRDGTTRG